MGKARGYNIKLKSRCCCESALGSAKENVYYYSIWPCSADYLYRPALRPGPSLVAVTYEDFPASRWPVRWVALIEVNCYSITAVADKVVMSLNTPVDSPEPQYRTKYS